MVRAPPTAGAAMRSPHEIATEAQALADTSNAAAVPLPRDQVMALMVEFMTSVAALIGDSGSPV